MELTLKVLDAEGEVLACAGGGDEAVLVYRKPYREGDSIVVEASGEGHIMLALDDAIAPVPVYLKGGRYCFAVPFAGRRRSYSPKAFDGDIHRLFAAVAHPDTVSARRNLALNPWDDQSSTTLFPHASANVETRGEAVFAARNAIDGEKASDDHGFWPYTSWGINRNPEASLTLDFGRTVHIDEIAFYLRADFPHDAWWEKASVTFPDGETLSFDLRKSGARQCFGIVPRQASWIRIHNLIKAEDPSPFPALTQVEVWGNEISG